MLFVCFFYQNGLFIYYDMFFSWIFSQTMPCIFCIGQEFLCKKTSKWLLLLDMFLFQHTHLLTWSKIIFSRVSTSSCPIEALILSFSHECTKLRDVNMRPCRQAAPTSCSPNDFLSSKDIHSRLFMTGSQFSTILKSFSLILKLKRSLTNL